MHRLIEGFDVIVDANKKFAGIGEILVGLGNTQIENDGLALQHKISSKQYGSLSQYVFDLKLEPSKENYHTLFVEDFSVDTILSIWIVLVKLNKQTMPENIDLWLKYASRWEKGDTSTTGKAFHSYGCLQNALLLNTVGITGKERLSYSLSFLDYLIGHVISPTDIPEISDFELYIRAKENLLKEYDKYASIVQNSEVVTLCVPQINMESCLKVSGVFIETNIISSIQKVFLRNDEKSPTKDGYALMAVYNEQAKGTGNDIVISINPIKHIHLKALWDALEKNENDLWEGNRPKDMPRPLTSYPNNNGPNEPWWDDMGNYTLIAAPKMLGSEYGRRVSWNRVKELIKQLYAKGAQL